MPVRKLAPLFGTKKLDDVNDEIGAAATGTIGCETTGVSAIDVPDLFDLAAFAAALAAAAAALACALAAAAAAFAAAFCWAAVICGATTAGALTTGAAAAAGVRVPALVALVVDAIGVSVLASVDGWSDARLTSDADVLLLVPVVVDDAVDVVDVVGTIDVSVTVTPGAGGAVVSDLVVVVVCVEVEEAPPDG